MPPMNHDSTPMNKQTEHARGTEDMKLAKKMFIDARTTEKGCKS
jgi:hypothetical protein